MTRRRALERRAAAAVLAVAVAAVALPAGTASASDTDRVAFDDQKVVELTQPRTSGSAAGLGVHQTEAGQVSARNAAVAYAGCDGCRAVSLSFQLVIAGRGPKDVSASNLALAMTENCTRCESLAIAQQVVVASDRQLRISSSGQWGLRSVRARLDALASSGKPLPQIRDEAEKLMAVVTEIATSELRSQPLVRTRERLARG